MLLARYEKPWNPFREMESVQSQMNSLINQLWGRQPVRTENGESLGVTEWVPLVDIAETDQAYLIKAELPEIKREEISVKVENGVLSLTGERKFEQDEKKQKFHRVERLYGKFTRSFTLPDDADDTQVRAEFKDGILTVQVGKAEKTKPRQIEVKVS